MAANDLTTLANVKAWLPGAGGGGIVYTTDDALLQRLITAVSSYVQNWLGRTIASAAYTDTRDGRGGDRISLVNYPVTAVAAVTIDGLSIPASPDGISAGFTFSDSTVFLIGYGFSRGTRNVAIFYTAGYAVTPSDLEQAVIGLVALRYRERDRIGLVSKGLAGETTAYAQQDMPADVAAVLAQYRRVSPTC
ncbi:MAG TPA: head-tail connector protein [Stellaceae bacterium]|nr:head-tail connector protein [Stellaceae bacterium]